MIGLAPLVFTFQFEVKDIFITNSASYFLGLFEIRLKT
jgi:hypothetical protein